MGPNRAGFTGLLQPLADGVKLIVKETIKPTKAKLEIFIPVACVGMLPVAGSWIAVFGDEATIVELQYGLLYLAFFLSLGVYPVLLAGLSSRSSYARLGGVRAVAQFLSYELAGGSIILSVALLVEIFCLNDILDFQEEYGLIIPIMPAALIFLIVSLAGNEQIPV